MKDNNQTIRNIKEVLEKFQRQYIKSDSYGVDTFLSEFFIDEEDTSFIGPGSSSWYFGLPQISDGINAYREDEHKYLKNIELDIDNSIINVEDGVATIAICGKSTGNIDEEKIYSHEVEKLSKGFNANNISKEEVLKASRDISRLFLETTLGEIYNWPFRVTMLMINKGENWMIKHMSISFCEFDSDIAFTNKSINQEFSVIPIEKRSNDDILEIQEVMENLQEAYCKRDVNLVDKYSEELFNKDENLFIFGTCDSEKFHGFNQCRELLQGDWGYWGDFNVNRENAFIRTYNNVAVVYSKAFVRFSSNEQSTYEGLCDFLHNSLIPENKSSKALLSEFLWNINARLCGVENSDEDEIVPLKFVGLLIKKDGKWKFNHMHFSVPVDGMPKDRIAAV
ncbi:MAG: hypothetical protein RR486_13885 [Clostridium sp.]|uniref:hypothetical protein n=1 Tax=Clostridium sp. TaxID=1506 RepID=UPI00306BBF98